MSPLKVFQEFLFLLEIPFETFAFMFCLYELITLWPVEVKALHCDFQEWLGP